MTEGEKMETGAAQEVTCLESGQILKHHTKYMCSGECCLHGTSPHEFCRKPRLWRSDSGIIEHLCKHGIGHPCAAGLAYAKAMESLGHGWGGDGVHGCDGCCTGHGPPDGPEQLSTPVLTLSTVYAKMYGHEVALNALADIVESLQDDRSRHSYQIYKLARSMGLAFWWLAAVSLTAAATVFLLG